jgi:hypothetical protein
MKKLGINIDGVIRNFHAQFDKQYRKVYIHNPSIVSMNEVDMTFKPYSTDEEEAIEKKILAKERELITLPMDSFDLLNHYKFDSKKTEMSKLDIEEDVNYDAIELSPRQNLEDFMYETYPFQVFGMADEYPGAMDILHKIQRIGLDNKQFEVILLSTLKGKAITATYEFLRKTSSRVKHISFVNSDEEKWDYCDALIDIAPAVFQYKPENKTSIKINHSFNSWDAADYSFNSIKEVCNEEFLNRVFSINQ